MNVTMVPDIDVRERISGDATPDQINAEQKQIAVKSSIYMNFEILSKLLSQMTSKDIIIRKQPE